MLGYLLRRLGTSIVMLFSVSVLIFVVLRLLPGDPVSISIGAGHRGVGAEELDQYRTESGLNRPYSVQYWLWLTKIFRGDFGVSYFSQENVLSMIGGHLMPTVELTFTALITAVIFSFTLAIIGATWPRSFADRVVTAIASLGMAIPTFITAIILLLTFGIWFPILPTRGYIPFSEDPIENLRLIAMPTMTLAFAAMAPILRMLRSSLGEAAGSPWKKQS